MVTVDEISRTTMRPRVGWIIYNPCLGRFISEDPASSASDDVNLYRYVKNNPLINSDPTGLFSMPGLINGIGNFLVGIGDALSFGLTKILRDAIGRALDLGTSSQFECSNSYKAGYYAAMIASIMRLAYAAIARLVSKIALQAGGRISAGVAAAARNKLKQAFRLGFFKNERVKSLAGMYGKYGNSTAVKRAAGRTNGGINAGAAGGAASGLRGGECGCQ